jgi:hypothetical protein
VFRYLFAWFPILIIAVANGAFRELIFAKVMTEPHAHQLSTLIGSVCIGAFIWFVILKWPPSSGRQALHIGLIWVILTVIFESFMGLVLQNRLLEEVIFEYNLIAGRVWILFLAWLGLAPWIFFRLRYSKVAT